MKKYPFIFNPYKFTKNFDEMDKLEKLQLLQSQNINRLNSQIDKRIKGDVSIVESQYKEDIVQMAIDIDKEKENQQKFTSFAEQKREAELIAKFNKKNQKLIKKMEKER